MEQAIRRGSRGRKPTKVVTFDEAENRPNAGGVRPQMRRY